MNGLAKHALPELHKGICALASFLLKRTAFSHRISVITRDSPSN